MYTHTNEKTYHVSSTNAKSVDDCENTMKFTHDITTKHAIQNAPSYKAPTVRCFIFLAVCTIFFLAGCSTTQYGSTSSMEVTAPTSKTAILGTSGSSTYYAGEKVSTIQADQVGARVTIADDSGNIVIIEGDTPAKPSPNYIAAKELKLKVRELAEQLISDITDPYLRRAVALPVSFVSLSNMQDTSSFGQLISEQLIYEFNQRGFPVREYRLGDFITIEDNVGEFYLTRAVQDVATKFPGAVVVAGTYHAEPDSIFINARLIRPTDGLVLRTANLVLPNNEFTKKMVKGGKPVASSLSALPITIKQSQTSITSAPTTTTPFDDGADIH